MNFSMNLTCLALGTLVLMPAHALAQATPPLSVCSGVVEVAACEAERGDRAEGWRAQTRAEVMAPHAMVVASQPLAAQAGLQMMLRGGNAIDAAVASSAVLNLVEPMMPGVAGDLFAIIYIAKDKKLYVLDASGTAPSGATIERGANLQLATDMARFRHAQVSNRLGLESDLYAAVGQNLAAMGHNVILIDGGSVGGFRSLLQMPAAPTAGTSVGRPHCFYRAGSDHRKDGQAVGW
jgi:gamma-glutamyltranspeptidase